MKKHKSVVAILLAVMMIFTMMPMMAFADTPAAGVASWGAKYASVKDTNGKEFKTARTFAAGTGLVTADPQDDDSVVGDKKFAPTSDAVFYDLDGSAFVFGANNTALDGKTFTQTAFEELALSIKVVEQSYTVPYTTGGQTYNAATAAHKEFPVEGAVDTSKKDAVFGTAALTNWTLTVAQSAYESGAETDQTVTFTLKSSKATDQVEPTNPETPDLDGTVATATVTVKGEDKKPVDAKFYFDKVVAGTGADEGETVTGWYDGSAHNIVCDNVPGWTVSYEIYNATTGKYESASTVSVKDVADPIQVKATFAKTGEKSLSKVFYAQLQAAGGADVEFDWEQSITERTASPVYSVSGSTFDAASYLIVTPWEYTWNPSSSEPREDAAHKTARLARNAAIKKAVAANEALIKEYFNAYYEIKEETTKDNPSEVRLTIVEKEMTAQEQAELDKKYEGLLANVGYVWGGGDARVLLNGAVFDYEVEFTKAPAGVTKFKAKKGKLPKNKAITVKAVSNNGATVAYKLVNANSKITINKKTGKITFKKGLKKGTYSFKVKAYIPGVGSGNNNVQGYYEYQTIKVKVK